MRRNPPSSPTRFMAGLVVLLTAGVAAGACPPGGLVAQATTGYGLNGSYSVGSLSFKNQMGSIFDDVYVYYPIGVVPAPAIFFSHPYGGRDPVMYQEMIAHFVSRGYAFIYTEYPTLGAAADKYAVLWGGMEEAVARYPNYIDTSWVAFFGHSFGGGRHAGTRTD